MPNEIENENTPLLSPMPLDFHPDSNTHQSKFIKIAYKLENSRIGRYWDLVDAFINTALCLFYLVLVSHVDLVYVDDNQNCPEGLIPFKKFCREYIPLYLQAIDASFCLILLLCVFTRSVLAMNTRYWYTGHGIVSLLTCLPPIVVFIKRCIDEDPQWILSYLSAHYIAFLYPIRWFRLKQSYTILLLPSSTSLFDFSVITRKVLQLTITITLMMLMVSCFIHIFHIIDVQEDKQKDENADKSFWETVFFTIMSASSGLSTSIIEIDTWYIQLFLVSILIAAIFYLPPQISHLIDLLRHSSYYTQAYKIEANTKHIIITGNFTTDALLSFLKEFYHRDHGYATSNINTIILNPDEPDDKILDILYDPMYSAKLNYIKGSSVDTSDLEKCKIKQASACFILNQSNSSANALDSEGLMRCLAVQKHNCPIYSQCLSIENKHHFKRFNVICMDEMRYGYMMQQATTPGVIPLLHILTTSISTTSETEYEFGLQNEFYVIPLPEILVNTSFVDAVRYMYPCIVIGIHRKTLLLHPSTTLQQNDLLVVIHHHSNVEPMNDINSPVNASIDVIDRPTIEKVLICSNNDIAHLPAFPFECTVLCPTEYEGKGVTYIQGSPLNQLDLIKAGIKTADYCLILKNMEGSNEYVVDAMNIATVLNIRELNKSIGYCVELQDLNNCRFISELDEEYLEEPLYQQGNVFSRGMLDGLTCQSYYNPFLVDLIHLLFGKIRQVQIKKEMRYEDVFMGCLPNIAIGIYRLVNGKYQTIPNPLREMRVTNKDYIFVLSK